MFILNKFRIAIALSCSIYAQTSTAVVCTDPVNTSLTTTQTAIQAENAYVSQYIDALKLSAMEAYGSWKQIMDGQNTLATIQKVNAAKTDTANLDQQTNMKPASTMCDAIAQTTALVSMVDDLWCEASSDVLDFSDALVNASTDDDADAPRKIVSDDLAQIIEDNTSSGSIDASALSLAGMTPGMGEAGYSKSEDEADRTKTLLKIAMGASDIDRAPTDTNQTPVSSTSSDELKRAYANWAKSYARTMVGYTTASRVNNLTNPREVDGTATISILEQLKNQVDYYNSEDMVKKLGNGMDKSCFTSQSFETEDEKQEWLQTEDGQACLENFTPTEEVIRISAQMDAVIQDLLFKIYESTLNSEMNLGLQTQILNEINERGYR